MSSLKYSESIISEARFIILSDILKQIIPFVNTGNVPPYMLDVISGQRYTGEVDKSLDISPIQTTYVNSLLM